MGLHSFLVPCTALALLLLVPHQAHAAELEASDGAAENSFGYSVSQSDRVGLAGAYSDAIGVNSNQGSAYVFRNLDTATGTVTQDVKLVASDGSAGDFFGWSVSQSGNIGLVGAIYNDNDNNRDQGSAYVFRNLDTATGTVTQNVKLTASDGVNGDIFGASVSLSGSIGLVGAYGDDNGSNLEQGSAYVFRNLDTATGTVTQDVKLTASDGEFLDLFGYSASLSGSIGLVGAYLDNIGFNNTDQGSAYVFRNLDTATGTVIQNAKLTASDGGAGDFFGLSVSHSGSIGVVGAFRDDIGANSDQGSAYVFRNLDAATGTVTQSVKLTASDGATEDRFGFSVSQFGSIGVVGAFRDDIGANSDQGSAYVFRNLDAATGTVTQSVKLTASDGASGDEFGSSVSLSGDGFTIGARAGDGISANSGKAYTGTVSSVTTLDVGNTSRTIDGISFISWDDWIIGHSTDNNSVTLTSGDAGDVTASGKRVLIGQNAGSDNNALTINGTLTNNEIVVGEAGGGTLTIGSTGQVTNTLTRIAYGAASSATVNVNGGTWNSTSTIQVAKSGVGTLNVTSGLAATTLDIDLGEQASANGTVNVSGGTLQAETNLTIGYLGRGTVNMTGGLLSTNGTTRLAYDSGGVGQLNLNGGTLSTKRVTEGSGSGTISFNGGTLQARETQADFLSGFESGDVTIQAGGGAIDSNGYTVGIGAVIGGPGALTKSGAGSLRLSGSNTYAGGTFVNAGTLIAGQNNAVGTGSVTVTSGSFFVESGVTLSNSIILAGGSFERSLTASMSLVGAIHATSSLLGGDTDTTASILGGTTSAAATIVATFTSSSGASNDSARTSEVLHLSGIPIVSGQITDIFVLELSMTSVAPGSYLGWLNGANEWVNAALGNTGNNATLAQQGFAGGFDAFQSTHGSTLSSYIGAWGFSNTKVWAVINHNSDFATVPEPSTWGRLVLGGAAIFFISRGNKQTT